MLFRSTLKAITNPILASTNAQINYDSTLTISNGFKGREVYFTYILPDPNGEIEVSYFRYYYNYISNVIISFSISGYQSNLTAIISNKNSFFNSISFHTTSP